MRESSALDHGHQLPPPHVGLRRAAIQLACVVGLLLGSSRVSADTAASPLGSHALAGLEHASLPRSSDLALAVDAGYGYTSAITDDPSGHHRASGSLAVGLPLTGWLNASLQLSGRYDKHPDDTEGSDDSLSGLPALRLRAFSSRDDLSFGGELQADFPGRDAPSIDWGSTSVAAVVMAAFQRHDSPLTVVVNAGYRLDNGAHSAPDLERLRRGDRIALGLSEYDAALLALGAGYRIGDGTLFAELSTNLLLGAPSQASSPKRLSAGYVRQVSRTLQARLLASVNIAQAPGVTPDGPLIAIEPSALISVGLRYSFAESDALPESSPESAPPNDEQPRSPPAPAHPTVERTDVRGVITDATGNPLAQVDVSIEVAGERHRTTTDASGRYSLESLPFGAATLRAETVDYVSTTKDFELSGDGVTLEIPALAMQLQSLNAQIQGQVQSFSGQPVAASVTITPGSVHQTGDDGRFSLELPPGTYTVTIAAPGFVSQTHRVTLKDKAVIVVNADLRAK